MIMKFILIKTRTYLVGALVFLALFSFLIAKYVAPYSSTSYSIQELKGRITGLPIINNDSIRANVFIAVAAAVLGISIVYLFLRVVSWFLFVAKE